MLLVLTTFFSALILQSSSASADSIYWFQNSGTLGITDQWALYGEIQPRYIGSLGQSQSVLMRGAILYRLNPELTLGMGYGWTPQYLPTPRNESRIYQQVEWKPEWPEYPLQWAFRGRMEERDLEGVSPVLYRARARGQVNWMNADDSFGFYLWDELFLNLNSGSKSVYSGFDQNRLSSGIRFKKSSTTLEAGPIWQRIRGGHSNTGGVLNLILNGW